MDTHKNKNSCSSEPPSEEPPEEIKRIKKERRKKYNNEDYVCNLCYNSKKVVDVSRERGYPFFDKKSDQEMMELFARYVMNC